MTGNLLRLTFDRMKRHLHDRRWIRAVSQKIVKRWRNRRASGHHSDIIILTSSF
jgi:hypothetical protein